jgi:hypothetical protein
VTLDSSAIFALLNRKDSFHFGIKTELQKHRPRNGGMVLSLDKHFFIVAGESKIQLPSILSAKDSI